MTPEQRPASKPQRRRAGVLTLALCALLALAAAAIATAEKPTTVKAGNLVFTANGGVTPKALPKKEFAPITLNVSGKIGTADGSHPPALTSAVVDTDKNGTIDATGVPTCKPGKLEARTSAEAERVCKAAIVGSGTTDVQIQFPESNPIPIKSKLLAFNGPGGGKGKATILIHAYLTSPVTAAIVTTVKVSKRANGPYGTRSVASVPTIAGGDGSVTAFDLTFDKKLFGSGKAKHGYLMAKCSNGSFKAQAELNFKDGTKVGPATITRACTPKG